MEAIGRKIFYAKVKGSIVFSPWCVIQGVKGEMIEPFNYERNKPDGSAFDPSMDDKITEIVEVDYGALSQMPPFADHGTVLHGGENPQEGYSLNSIEEQVLRTIGADL